MASGTYDLVILAAGMGSRFGGLKQVEPVGPGGELIIEYSVADALQAGFDRLVLVIRKEIEADFRATIGRRLERRIEVAYVVQEIHTGLPDGMVPSGRTKPWGTGHAVLAARTAVRRPFAVINADDFYGASGYAALAGHFGRVAGDRANYALVGYPLAQTLSEFGTVSRGLCATDAAGRLERITELTNIEKNGAGARFRNADGGWQALSGSELVSMNFWGFTPAVFPQLEERFAGFLRRSAADPRAEFYLPTALSTLHEERLATVSLLSSSDAWFGLTYREDLAVARSAVQAMIAAGKYPAPLWGPA